MVQRKPTKAARADEPFEKRLGARIRAVRESKKRSMMDLVRTADWSIGHLGKIERGEVDVRASTLKRLADDLKVPVSAFFEGL